MRDRGSEIVDIEIRVAPIVPAHLEVSAARKVAALRRAAVVLVENGGRLLGLVDARTLADAADEVHILAVARPIDLVLRPTTSLRRARELLLRSRTTALPVAAGAFLLGVVHLADVERALRREASVDAGRTGTRAVA